MSQAVAVDDPWAASAPFYDLDLQDLDADIDMYREFARRQGGAVLELGCGTGRVAAPLAHAGISVVGVDYSRGMLDVARAACAGLPVRIVEGDMRTVRLRQRFPTVLIPFGGLQHLDTTADIAAALETAAYHVMRRGIVIADVESPHPDDLAPGPQPLVVHWTRPWRDGLVTKLVAVEGRPSEGLRLVTFHYDVQPASGPLRRVSHQFTLRVVTEGELELAGRVAGLRLAAAYGDYELSPRGDGDDRIVALFERA